MAIYTFFARAYHLPRRRFKKVQRALHIDYEHENFYHLHRRFYVSYERGFCCNNENVQTNVHTAMHLYDSVKHSGPLYETTAEQFESHYALVRSAFRAGTPNTAKQAMENCYLRDT